MAFIDAVLGALLVFLATGLGSIVVLFVDCLDRKTYAVMLSFAAGVMLFSAIEMFDSATQSSGWLLATICLLLGALVFIAMEKLLPHLHLQQKTTLAGDKNGALIAGAVTLHNVPEGLAVGSAFASSTPLGWLVAFSMALQDIPEGLSVSAPLACFGMQKRKSIWFGIFSGVVEAVSAVIGYCLLLLASWVVPFGLAISAGAMLCVVLVELLPDAFRGGHVRVAAFSLILGFGLALGLASLLRF